MPSATRADVFLLEGFLFCIGLFYLAVIIYGLIRSGSPELAWHRQGNVITEHLDRWDLLGVVIVFLVYGGGLMIPFVESAEPKAASPRGVWLSSLMLMCVVIIPLALIGRKGRLVEVLGLRYRQPLWTLPALAIGGYISAVLLVLVTSLVGIDSWIVTVFGPLELQEVVQLMAETDDPALKIAIGTAAVVVAPIVEEIFFRGYLYTVAKRFSDRFFAAIISSLIFALMHGSIHAVIPLFVLAMIMALLFEMTGSLWAPIALHMLFNGITTANLLFGEPALPASITLPW